MEGFVTALPVSDDLAGWFSVACKTEDTLPLALSLDTGLDFV